MSKNSPPHPDANSESLDWVDSIRESDIFNKMIEHRRNLPYVFLLVVIVLAVSFKFMSGKTQRAESSYLLAENYQMKIMRSISSPEGVEIESDSLSELSDIVASYPELHPKYDGTLAQMYLVEGNTAEAKALSKQIVKRVGKDQFAHQQALTQGTFTIADREFVKAFEEAEVLQQNLTDNDRYLLAFNVIRMGMLQQEIGNASAELEAWELWNSLAKRSDYKASFDLVGSQFKDGNYTLNEYIETRKRELTN